MKKVKMFYLENCPHCKRAFKMIEAIKSKNPQYENIEFDLVEESQNVKMASTYDYYLVPTFYVGDKKIHEGVPSFEAIELVLKEAM